MSRPGACYVIRPEGSPDPRERCVVWREVPGRPDPTALGTFETLVEAKASLPEVRWQDATAMTLRAWGYERGPEAAAPTGRGPRP